MIRVIGNRGHALISVNYFAVLGTVGSMIALLVIPGIGFTMPQGAREWILLTLLGFLGFVLQFLLTAGLQLDKSSKATSMLYTGVLFALSFDWAIWGVLPGKWSLFGGSIIIGSTLWSALQKPMDHLQTLRKRLQMRKVLFLVLKQRMETEYPIQSYRQLR
jgi:drug/metabolite transporter (DMT)-like permease